MIDRDRLTEFSRRALPGLAVLTLALGGLLLAFTPVWHVPFASIWSSIDTARPLPGLIDPAPSIRLLVHFLFAASTVALAVTAAVAAGLTTISLIFWVAATGFAVAMSTDMAPLFRAMDGNGHYSTILFYTDRLGWPGATDCLQCYHPPAYHFLAGQLVRMAMSVPGLSEWIPIRAFSLFLFSFYSLFALKTFKETLPSRSVIPAFVLFLAPPLTFFISGRIGNDQLVFPLWAGAIYFLVRWEKMGRTSDVLSAAALIAAIFLTKGTAAVPAAVFIATVATVFIRQPRRRTKVMKHAIWGSAILATGIAFYCSWSSEFIASGLTGNLVMLPEASQIPKDWTNIFRFSPSSLLWDPLYSPTAPQSREYFLNFWLKTLVGGEFGYSHLDPRLHPFVLGSLLAMLGAWIAAAVGSRMAGGVPAALLWTVILSPVFSALYRYKDSMASSADFRYVHPWLIAFAAIYLLMLERLDEKGKNAWRWAGLLALGVFAVAGFTFTASDILR